MSVGISFSRRRTARLRRQALQELTETIENTDLPSRPRLSHNHRVSLREMANSICDTLRGNGYQALLVGGCVRDVLLGREPADYDVTTDATPEEVARLFPESIAVGAQFGVILIPRDGLKVEVATFRSDVGYSDGRHPDRVVYSKTAQEDVQRRDFTINGLLMRHDTGEVLDFVDGQADLEAKVIRAIGEPDRRFAEDKLRMMRAVRFAARFGFEIEGATFLAICRHVSEIHQVSPERLREELTKLLTEGAARRAAPSVRSLVSSSRRRSGETWWISLTWRHIARNVAPSISKPKRAANRTARIMRSLSSAKRRSGSPMARMTFASRSACPSTKSR